MDERECDQHIDVGIGAVASIRFFNQERGYGFALLAEGRGEEVDLFFHVTKFGKCFRDGLGYLFAQQGLTESEMTRHLFKGAEIVVFEIGEGEKGRFALRWTIRFFIESDAFCFVFEKKQDVQATERDVQTETGGVWKLEKTEVHTVLYEPIFVGSEKEALLLVNRSPETRSLKRYEKFEESALEFNLRSQR